MSVHEFSKTALVDYLKTERHEKGAWISLPEAVHLYECNAWRAGGSFQSCICGADELQKELDEIFG